MGRHSAVMIDLHESGSAAEHGEKVVHRSLSHRHRHL